MRNDQILQIAISKRISQDIIGEDCKSAFSVVHQCICSVDNLRMTEKEKKQELIKRFQNFWCGSSKYIADCKREQIRNIVKHAFGIGSMQNNALSTNISSFSFRELFLYYCYVERIAQSDREFSQFLWKDYDKKLSKAFLQKRAEEQKIKEDKENAELIMLKGMSNTERCRYEIFEKQQDVEYFQKLNSDKILNEDEKTMIAGILKEYWIKAGKWEVQLRNVNR